MIKPPILIIDDDTEDLNLIKEMIQELGCQNPLVSFTTADAAFHYLERSIEIPFFILCDENMPLKNGLELRSKLLECGPPIRDIPFILLLASKSEVTEMLAIKHEINLYFQKPSSLLEMVRLIKIILSYMKVDYA